MDLSKLKEPFAEQDIEWRIGQSGKNGEKYWAKVLAYLTNRAVMDRLDEVVGPANWRAEYALAPHDPDGKALLCTLYLRIGGEWIGKTDGANSTDIEPVKGGISDSMKRAAVQWGIGRYLYHLGETWAECTTDRQKGDGWHWAKTKDGTFYWRAPGLPKNFLPSDKRAAAMNAAPGKLVPASELDAHKRGDDGNWHQWTSPPPEVAATGEPHEWHLQAIKGLLYHCGASSIRKARLLFLWLSPDEPICADEARTDPAVAFAAWNQLCEKSNSVPFKRMLHEAMQSVESAA